MEHGFSIRRAGVLAQTQCLRQSGQVCSQGIGTAIPGPISIRSVRWIRQIRGCPAGTVPFLSRPPIRRIGTPCSGGTASSPRLRSSSSSCATQARPSNRRYRLLRRAQDANAPRRARACSRHYVSTVSARESVKRNPSPRTSALGVERGSGSSTRQSPPRIAGRRGFAPVSNSRSGRKSVCSDTRKSATAVWPRTPTDRLSRRRW